MTWRRSSGFNLHGLNRDGKIAAIGSLTPLPEERQIDARDCVIYPAWVNTEYLARPAAPPLRADR
jgi:cytosine/adenosine deaminase-related metal-dependent hydrolase